MKMPNQINKHHYDLAKVRAEAKEILETDPTKVDYKKYRSARLTAKSPLVKKIFAFTK